MEKPCDERREPAGGSRPDQDIRHAEGVRHVDLTIGKGEIHALLGENGAGKSTLVKMLFGSLEPNSGEILWNGEAVTHHQSEHGARSSASAWFSSIFRCSRR